MNRIGRLGRSRDPARLRTHALVLENTHSQSTVSQLFHGPTPRSPLRRKLTRKLQCNRGKAGSQSGSAAPDQTQVPTVELAPGGYSIVASEVNLSQRPGCSLSLFALYCTRLSGGVLGVDTQTHIHMFAQRHLALHTPRRVPHGGGLKGRHAHQVSLKLMAGAARYMVHGSRVFIVASARTTCSTARQLLDRPRQTSTDLDRPRQTSTDLDRPGRPGAWSQARQARQELDSNSTGSTGKASTAPRQRLDSASTAPRQRLDGASTARQLDSQGSSGPVEPGWAFLEMD